MTERSAPPGASGWQKKQQEVRLASSIQRISWRRIALLLLGPGLFLGLLLSPTLPGISAPGGEYVTLGREGQAALGLFFWALVWWVSEAVPIGVTSIAVAVVQVLFLIRPARTVFTDYLDPSVWFIFACLVIGMALTKTGLAKRLAYRTLVAVGDRTLALFIGMFLLIAALTTVMSHTAVAATVFPLLMAVYSLYDDDARGPTRFGRGLFMGMAFACEAGSVVTLFGAARGPLAIGLYRNVTGEVIPAGLVTYYLLPLGWTMLFLLAAFLLIRFKAERPVISGLKDRAKALYSRLGPMTRQEKQTLVLTSLTLLLVLCSPLIPGLKELDETALLLTGVVFLFLTEQLSLQDLEEIPWNILLLFGGGMSLGLCLWQTGAARWLGLQGLVFFSGMPAWLFVMISALFVLLLTNCVLNAASIALCLPVTLVIASYMGVSSQLVLFSVLAAAGMPFLLLIGAAANAIAYGSRQFRARQFLLTGAVATVILLCVLALFVQVIWPAMGMK